MSSSVHTALKAFSTPASTLNPLASNQKSCTPGTTFPLGLSRPVDRNLEDKILRGEYMYIDFALPDNLYQSQTPEIQLRLDDLSSGPMGSPVTMVRKKKLCHWHVPEMAWRVYGLYASLSNRLPEKGARTD